MKVRWFIVGVTRVRRTGVTKLALPTYSSLGKPEVRSKIDATLAHVREVIEKVGDCSARSDSPVNTCSLTKVVFP